MKKLGLILIGLFCLDIAASASGFDNQMGPQTQRKGKQARSARQPQHSARQPQRHGAKARTAPHQQNHKKAVGRKRHVMRAQAMMPSKKVDIYQDLKIVTKRSKALASDKATPEEKAAYSRLLQFKTMLNTICSKSGEQKIWAPLCQQQSRNAGSPHANKRQRARTPQVPQFCPAYDSSDGSTDFGDSGDDQSNGDTGDFGDDFSASDQNFGDSGDSQGNGDTGDFGDDFSGSDQNFGDSGDDQDNGDGGLGF